MAFSDHIEIPNIEKTNLDGGSTEASYNLFNAAYERPPIQPDKAFALPVPGAPADKSMAPADKPSAPVNPNLTPHSPERLPIPPIPPPVHPPEFTPPNSNQNPASGGDPAWVAPVPSDMRPGQPTLDLDLGGKNPVPQEKPTHKTPPKPAHPRSPRIHEVDPPHYYDSEIV